MTEIRDGWHQVITGIPEGLTMVAYRYESGGWFIPDPTFNEASLVGATISPLYSQAEVDELLSHRTEAGDGKPTTNDPAPSGSTALTTEQVRRMIGVAPVNGLRDWKVEFDRWLTEHDRQVSEAAWSQGRRESTDVVLDGAGFRVVARNADNPFTAAQSSDLEGTAHE